MEQAREWYIVDHWINSFDRSYNLWVGDFVLAGAEWQNDFGLLPDYYSTFYREYDAVLGRFNSTDPLADNFESWTPYQFGYNNPVRYNDPDGDMTAEQAMDFLLDSPYGGTWTSNSDAGGTTKVFNSESEAFIAGVDYITDNNAWDKSGAYNYEQAAIRFNYETKNKYNIPLLMLRGVEVYGKSDNAIKYAAFAAHLQQEEALKKNGFFEVPSREEDLTNEFMYPGVTINLRNDRDQGYFNPFTNSINLPGWIKGNPVKMRDYIRHEYGHYLQVQKYGKIDFLFLIVPVSIASAKDDNHLDVWVEVEANRLSNNYFQQFYPNRYGAFFDSNKYKTK